MNVIRYGIHSTALAVAAVIFWVARDVRLPIWISNFNLLHYGLMGALHATSIVVSLRGRREALRTLGFITLATALSAFTPFLGLFGSVVWLPFVDTLREIGLGGVALLVTGSAIGASGYWLLVQLFWIRTFRRAGWLWTVAFCISWTSLVALGLHLFGGYDRGVARIDDDTISPLLTFGWWLAFSTSLYWSETTEHTSGLSGFHLGLMRKASIGLGLALPSMLVIWYLAAVWWAPMDGMTMLLPQRVRSTLSHDLAARAGFGAEGFPLARRAVKLDPASEDAWTRLCATGVRDGTDLEGALKACSHAASMTDRLFHAEVIARAYEETDRPCEGLPVLRKTMGPEQANNISPIFSVGRLEAACGELENAERHLRTVVRLREEDLRPFNWEDRPPRADDSPNSYENASRLYLSKARQNLSALLTLRNRDAEAFDVCRSALGNDLKRCACRFEPRHGVACETSTTE